MVEKILKIIDLIEAVKLFIAELHLSALDYQTHLLMDRLNEGFDDLKDGIQETSIQVLTNLSQKYAIFSSQRQAQSVANYLALVPVNRDYEHSLDYLAQFYQELLETAEKVEAPVALRKELDDLCAKLSRDLYLLSQTMKRERDNGKDAENGNKAK